MAEFDIQQSEIGKIEEEAGVKKPSLEIKLRQNRDLFIRQVDKAEIAFEDALKTLTGQEGKDTLKADQEKIRNFLKQVAEKGYSILKEKGGTVDDIGKIAGELGSGIRSFKSGLSGEEEKAD